MCCTAIRESDCVIFAVPLEQRLTLLVECKTLRSWVDRMELVVSAKKANEGLHQIGVVRSTEEADTQNLRDHDVIIYTRGRVWRGQKDGCNLIGRRGRAALTGRAWPTPKTGSGELPQGQQNILDVLLTAGKINLKFEIRMKRPHSVQPFGSFCSWRMSLLHPRSLVNRSHHARVRA